MHECRGDPCGRPFQPTGRLFQPTGRPDNERMPLTEKSVIADLIPVIADLIRNLKKSD